MECTYRLNQDLQDWGIFGIIEYSHKKTMLKKIRFPCLGDWRFGLLVTGYAEISVFHALFHPLFLSLHHEFHIGFQITEDNNEKILSNVSLIIKRELKNNAISRFGIYKKVP